MNSYCGKIAALVLQSARVLTRQMEEGVFIQNSGYNFEQLVKKKKKIASRIWKLKSEYILVHIHPLQK